MKLDIVDAAFAGALVGLMIGGIFCCYQMLMNGADLHIVRDAASGAVVGALLLGTLSLIRNWIVRSS
jgi:hypothetical protein